jgi:hypothetical protein
LLRAGNIKTQPMISPKCADYVTTSFKNRWRALMSVDDVIADTVRRKRNETKRNETKRNGFSCVGFCCWKTIVLPRQARDTSFLKSVEQTRRLNVSAGGAD